MLYSNPPVPSDAFVGESASSNAFAFLENDEEIFEGVITAKKEKEGYFFWKRSGHHNHQQEFEDVEGQHQLEQQAGKVESTASISPRPIQLLIYSRRRMERCLRDLGSGSSCLWVPSEEFCPNGKAGRMAAKQLYLAYCSRSEWGWQSFPILSEATLELGPLETSEQASSGQIGIHESLRHQYGKEKNLSNVMKSSNDAVHEHKSSNDDSSLSWRENLGGSHRGLRSTRLNDVEKKRHVTLTMSKWAYLQLLALVSPQGGPLREYQETLKRLVQNSNFIDVDVSMVDFRQWFEQHPLAIFLDKNDIVIVKREGRVGVFWTLLRFYFDHDGLVKVTSGRSLTDLELHFGKGDAADGMAAIELKDIKWTQNDHDSSHDGKEGEKRTLQKDTQNVKRTVWTSCHLMDWAQDGDKSTNPLLRVITEAMGNENPLSTLESSLLASILRSKEAEKAFCHNSSSLAIIPTVLKAEMNCKLSSKEKYALTCLGSDLPKLKERALFDLLSLLLKSKDISSRSPYSTSQALKENISNRSPHSNRQMKSLCSTEITRAAHRANNSEEEATCSSPNPCPDSGCPQIKGNLSLNHDLSCEEAGCGLGRRRAPLQAQIDPANDGSQSNPDAEVISSTKDENFDDQTREFEPLHGEKIHGYKLDGPELYSGGLDCEINQAREGGMDPMRIMDWLRGGFLEAVFDKYMIGSHDEQQSLEAYLDKGGETVSVEVIVAAWMKVLEMIPKPSGSHLARLLVLSLQKVHAEVMKLNLNNKTRVRHAKCTTRDGAEMEEGIQGVVKEGFKMRLMETNLQLILEKLSKIGKLLSPLMAKSPILASFLAQSGGLDLLFDMYFCLVKKFPINLRFGALSSMKNSRGFNDTADNGNLPGETISVQERPLKVLPCILPSACICRYATTCLMDHCMTPRSGTVDISWPHADESHSNGMFPLKNLVNPYCHMSASLHKNRASNSARHANFAGNVQPGNCSNDPTVACNDGDEPADIIVGCNERADHEDLDSPNSKLTNEANAIENGIQSSPNVCCNDGMKTRTESQPRKTPCSTTEDELLGLSRDKRGGKPPSWNVLNRTCTSSSNTSPRLIPLVSTELLQSKGSDAAPISERECYPSDDQDMCKFNIFSVVYNLKLHFLQTMSSLVSSWSMSLCRSRKKLIQRFHNEGDNKLLLQFLPDIIGAILNLVPKTACNKIKKLIFEIIMALDVCGSSTANSTCQHPSDSNGGGMLQHLWGPCINISCSNVSDVLLAQGLIHEIGERLRILLCHLERSPCESPNSKDFPVTADQQLVTTRAWKYCDPLFESTTISNGHLLSLWVDIGLLLGGLTSFISLWPGHGHQAVKLVLNHVGTHIENVLQFLATHSSESNWSLAHIVTMEHLLQLFVVCMSTNSAAGKGPEQEVQWSDIDDFFWRLLAVNDSHWICIKNFATWIAMKSCEGCLRTLFEGYQKVLWEPLEVYYGMLGQKMDYKILTTTGTARSSSDIGLIHLNTSVFVFIKLHTLLMKRRLKCQREGTHSSGPPLYLDKLSFFLEFLMNPETGLLMSIISSPAVQSGSENLNVTSVLDLHGTSRFNTRAGNNTDCVVIQISKQCKKCSLRNALACQKLSFCKFSSASWMKQECLGILANVFSLTSPNYHDEQASLSARFRGQNPFLFAKYAKPFLEVVFFLFLRIYNLKTDNNGSASKSKPVLPPCSPFDYFKQSLNTGSGGDKEGRSCECASFSNKPLSEIRGQNDGLCSCCSCCCKADECTSRLCVMYAKIMRALAQNQTRDVSHSFRHTGVMRFLVQQISLEYENSSQVPGDQENTSLDSAPARASLQKLPQFEMREFQGRGDARAVGLSLSDRTNKMQHHDKTRDPARDECTAAATTRKGKQELKSAFRCTLSNLKDPVFDKRAVGKTLIVGLESALSSSQRSRLIISKSLSQRPCSGLDKRSLAEPSANDKPHDLGFQVGTKLRSPLLDAKYQSCKQACNLNLMNAGDTDLDPEIATLKAPTHEKHAEQTTNACLNLFDQSSRTKDKAMTTAESSEAITHDAEIKEQDIQQMDVKKQELACCYPNHQQGLRTAHLVNSLNFNIPGVAIAHNQEQNQLQELTEKDGRITPGPTQVKYAGRFFDLNEEVERELANEFVDAHDQDYSSYSDQNVQQKGIFLGLNGTYESKLSPVKINSSTLQGDKSEQSVDDDPEPLPKLENTVQSPKTVSRPTIPKLNLSKSTRKGGPIVSLDHSSFSSFSMSSLDSKPASSAASLHVQKEVPKSRSSRDYSSSRDYNSSNVNISSVKADATYDQERKRRRLHRHSGLHVILLEIFISLMLTPEGALETHYSDRYPMETNLNNAANLHLLPCLSERVKGFKPAAYRILKLSWRALFNPRIYVNRVRIARGASSQVYTATVQKLIRGSEKAGRSDTVVLKTVDVPKGPHDPCKFFDVYSEVEILEKFLGEQAVCQLLDYGVDKESFILVLKHYKCSLHTWRRGQSIDSAVETFSPNESQSCGAISTKFSLERLPLYLEVFSAVLQAVKILELRNIVHYDIKCDNILLDPIDSSCPESEFWKPRWPPEDASKPLPFRICIADFGQSKASAYIGGECTMRNRGTEYVKSPEMLKLLSNRSAQDKESSFYKRNTEDCVGKAVDVWSLGCLLYELMTGEYLFYDEDWLQFFMRVTLPSEDLITKEKVAQLENYRPIVDLLKFILVRDPLQRPSLDNVAICVEQLQLKLASQRTADLDRSKESSSQEAQSFAKKELGFPQEAESTTGKESGIPERTQSFTEEESDTDQSTLDGPLGPPIGRRMPAVRPHLVDPIPRSRRDSTESWMQLLCRCQCLCQEGD